MQPQSVSVGYASSAGLHRECQCDDSDFLFKIVVWHIDYTHTHHTHECNGFQWKNIYWTYM